MLPYASAQMTAMDPLDPRAFYLQQMMQGGQPAPQPAPAMPQQAAPQQAPAMPAQASPMGGQGLGGFLSNLFGGGQSQGYNQTVQWLTGQGLDPGRAMLVARDKPTLQKFLLMGSQGQKPIEVNGRLVDPNTYEVIADFSDQGEQKPLVLGPGEKAFTPGGDLIARGGKPKKERTEMERAYTRHIREAQGAGEQPMNYNEFITFYKGAGKPETNINLGDELSPGWEAVDKDFATSQYVPWKSGGFADTAKQLAELDQGLQILESGQAVTGAIGVLPDMVQALVNPDGTIAKENIEGVVQRSLREVLGAQFTEKEGERLIKRAFNPLLSPQVNAVRARRLISQIGTMAQSKQAMVDYFDEHGTLRGYQGERPSIASVESLILGMDRDSNLGVGNLDMNTILGEAEKAIKTQGKDPALVKQRLIELGVPEQAINQRFGQ